MIMKKNKLVIKSLAVALAVASVVGISVTHIQKSKADSVSDDISVESSSEDVKMTKTFRNHYDDMSNMTEEEFCEVFSSEEYIKEFNETYSMLVTRGGNISELQEKLQGLTENDIDNIAEEIGEKIPSAFQDGIMEKIKEILGQLTDPVITEPPYDLPDDPISYIIYLLGKLGIPDWILRPVVEIIISYIERVLL